MKEEFYWDYELRRSRERFWNMIALSGTLGVVISVIVSFLAATH